MADLEQQLKQLAAQASVLSEAQGAVYDPQTRHQHAESRAPGSTHGEPLLDEIKRRAATLNGPTSYRNLIKWVELELKARRHSKPPRQRKPQEIVLQDFEGLDYKAVAYTMRVHFTTIWRWRAQAGLRGTDGLSKDAVRPDSFLH